MRKLAAYHEIHAWAFVVVIILNVIFSGMEPPDGDEEDRRNLLEIFKGNLNDNERILAAGLASEDGHETWGNGTTVLGFIILV